MTETNTVVPGVPISRLLAAGASVAVLDGAFAVVIYVHVLHACSTAQLMQSIASALLGRAAFRGGGATVALGLALHCAVAYGWTLIYAAPAGRISTTARAHCHDPRRARGWRNLRCLHLARDGLAVGAAHSREHDADWVAIVRNHAHLARGRRGYTDRFDRARTSPERTSEFISVPVAACTSRERNGRSRHTVALLLRYCTGARGEAELLAFRMFR